MMNITFKRSVRAAMAILCAGALMAGASACGGSGSSSAGGDKVALLVSTLNNPFFVDLRDGAQAEAKKLGLDLQVSDAQNDSSTQQNQAQNAQSQGAKAVIINPVDSDAAGPAVAPLLSTKLPVISVDRAVTGEEVDSHVASDNVAGGAQAADELAKAIGEKGQVLILQGTPGAASTRDRGKGFKDEIKKYPGITIAAEQTANFDRSQALDVATNLMQSKPDAVGIYAENDEMALGAVQALGAKAGTDVKVFGFDGTDDGLKQVADGKLVGTIAQQPKELGRKAVQNAAKLIKGEKVQKTEQITVKTVTKENVADFQ
ncbi:D-ribose ABC transporter substrate-binding protein [Bifidobacterium mongoliense]|uniref:Periplasmic-binding protein/LacI transcriptional regulator n=1 Tax=Bifidobacterium mongoliense DSM 21395 TaxID=1437603 RepID=A0A087C7H9_9BIFI|nr:D-ribose ABC transporter substrate-binding protein [Bifidobacterium mongoliense]KFI79229.1 periplasmic-binding protein/LacI transcriptional regulator [Bifidobacterium mongoliense DSM 21395]MDN5633350.1 D-ribose ABC transporter substrate-binding protein [Bifidobacterium mongoliense]MDN6025153.1 D-ribose ABC transporter substrate-binding protein [Bifidobacterium mongoliense]MDN6051393.1 D-ribose ABC transporter substrate-binding protein [Bifidobacterium mongoliense]MDN6720570.1 D-ribose ABC t